MGKLTIIRGLPGAGKSRLGHFLAEQCGCFLLEPDQFLTCDGRYCYTPAEYQAAERLALDFAAHLEGLGCDLVYADVLPRKVDVRRVIDAYGCDEEDAMVVSLAIGTAASKANNRHHVNPLDIRAMARAWQQWPGEHEERPE